MAHAIHGYAGQCKNIHGHSYELHVTVAAVGNNEDFIAAPGFIIDFKQIKQLVQQEVIEKFDHKLVLSKAFITEHPAVSSHENLVQWEMEPSAENMLLFIQRQLASRLPAPVVLAELRLYETADSCARWSNQAIG